MGVRGAFFSTAPAQPSATYALLPKLKNIEDNLISCKPRQQDQLVTKRITPSSPLSKTNQADLHSESNPYILNRRIKYQCHANP